MNTDTLVSYMKARGLSQSELARRVGVSRQAVSLWFRSGEASVRSSHLFKVCEALEVRAERLARPLPGFGNDHDRLKATFLWDRLYPDLDDFAIAVNAWRPEAVARLVQVSGLYVGERLLGRRGVAAIRRVQALHSSGSAATTGGSDSMAHEPDSALAARVLPAPLYRALGHVFAQGVADVMLVGGTALAGYYAGHRRSDDLDLFVRDTSAFQAVVHAAEALTTLGCGSSRASGQLSSTMRRASSPGSPFTCRLWLMSGSSRLAGRFGR